MIIEGLGAADTFKIQKTWNPWIYWYDQSMSHPDALDCNQLAQEEQSVYEAVTTLVNLQDQR